MDDTETNRSVLVITGMHRSGTSLTTSLIESAGIFIGDRLMGAGIGNTKGHFEDWDFVDLHRQCLTAQKVSREGWTRQSNFTFSPEYIQRAKTLVAARSQYSIWGWKDPRTTLFLNCWDSIIPEAKFVFIYRSPWDVVDSLFRRGDSIFQAEPTIAIATWLNYNQTILKFCQQTNKPWILLRIEDIIQQPQLVFDSINQKLKLNLRSPQDLYDRSLFESNKANSRRAAFIQQYFPQAFELYLQLHQQATLIGETKLTGKNRTDRLRVLQNWLDKPDSQDKSIMAWSKLKQLVVNQSVAEL